MSYGELVLCQFAYCYGARIKAAAAAAIGHFADVS